MPPPTPPPAGARTYRIGRGGQLFLVLATLAFLGAAVAAGVQERTPTRRMVASGIFLALAAAGVASLIQARRYRVTIDDEGIELVRWRRVRRRNLDQLLGYRRFRIREGVLLIFEPRDRGAKPFKVIARFTLDAPFDAWLKRLPDLDGQDLERSEAALLASAALGATPTERKAVVARARLVARLLNWPAIAVALWVFFVPRPYGYAVGAALLFPLLALATGFLGRGIYQFIGFRGDARPAIGLALFAPWVGASIRAFDFDLVTPSPLLGPALGVGGVLTALLFMGDRTLRERPLWALSLWLLFTGTSASALTVANCVLDHSTPAVHEATLLSKRVATGRGGGYFLVLGPWGPRTAPSRMTVRRPVYDSVTAGAPMNVHLMAGRLGLPWFRLGGPVAGSE